MNNSEVARTYRAKVFEDTYGDTAVPYVMFGSEDFDRVYLQFEAGDELVDMSYTPEQAKALAKELRRLAKKVEKKEAKRK
jgi:hypothetical protein